MELSIMEWEMKQFAVRVWAVLNRKKFGWLLTIAGGLALAVTAHQQLQVPLNEVQQTVTSSSTRVVVVVIPGFPIESILIGGLLGLTVLMVIRRRKRKGRVR